MGVSHGQRMEAADKPRFEGPRGCAKFSLGSGRVVGRLVWLFSGGRMLKEQGREVSEKAPGRGAVQDGSITARALCAVCRT